MNLSLQFLVVLDKGLVVPLHFCCHLYHLVNLITITVIILSQTLYFVGKLFYLVKIYFLLLCKVAVLLFELSLQYRYLLAVNIRNLFFLQLASQLSDFFLVFRKSSHQVSDSVFVLELVFSKLCVVVVLSL